MQDYVDFSLKQRYEPILFAVNLVKQFIKPNLLRDLGRLRLEIRILDPVLDNRFGI